MIGEARDIISVYSRAVTPDGYGGGVEAFSLKWSGFAEIERIGGGKDMQGQVVQMAGVYRMKVRQNPSIIFYKTDKIVWRSKTLAIADVNDDDRAYTEITARASE